MSDTHPINMNQIKELTIKKHKTFWNLLTAMHPPGTDIDALMPRCRKVSQLDQTHIEDYFFDNQPLLRFTCWEKDDKLGIDVEIYKKPTCDAFAPIPP